MAEQDEEGDLCPDCEEYRGTNLGVHWARSKECSYPVLSEKSDILSNASGLDLTT